MHELDISDVPAWLLETEVTEVVKVNNNGKPCAVILPYELFEAMQRNNRTALRADELSSEDLEAIRNSSPSEESGKYDDELDD